MRLNTEGQLTSGEWCNEKDPSGSGLTTGLTIQWCEQGAVNGPWKFIEEKKQMYHTKSNKCLGMAPESGKPILSPCDDNNAYHKWTWKENRPRWAKS